MNKKRWLALGIAGALFIASIGMSAFQTNMADTVDGFLEGIGEPFQETVIQQGTDPGKVAVINIDGVIMDDGGGGLLGGGYNHQMLLDQLAHAAEDPDVHGVVLRVNTPGGGVVESDEIHHKITQLQEDYRKQVYVSMGGMAASGGYYISAPAEQIYANPQTITGSLGVIMQSLNVSELAEEWGIEQNVIKSGEFKDIMSATREMTDAERDLLQELVDDAHSQFVDVIEEGRDLSRDEVTSLADGRIFTGSQAYEAGLVDGLGHQEDVVAELLEDLGRGNLDVVEYEAHFGFPALLGSTAQQLIESGSLNDLTSWVRQNQGARLLYLYSD